MKPKVFLSILALGIIISAYGQNTLELTFTAFDSAAYVQLDSIKVMNRTQGGDTVLYYPDTVLVLEYTVGMPETNPDVNTFKVFQNYPNPVIDQTTISFYIPEKDRVNLIVTDLLGRELIKTERILKQGYHSYKFTPGNGSLFLFTAQWRGNSSSIKILNQSRTGQSMSLQYTGRNPNTPVLKTILHIQSFPFSLGDELLYIGYTDTLQSGMLDSPMESQTYTFQFATNISCPGTPTVTYEGQVYNTIQIFSQCWLKENLNVGTMIPGIQHMSDNDTIEKYCYDNEPDSCTKYGGLYQWDEMMQYATQQGVQGICPPGWHIPTDEEWKVLEGAVDSEYGIGNQEWDDKFYRGFDAGKNMKTTSGWYFGGNGTDLFGFSGLPGGYRSYSGNFGGLGGNGRWWSATGGTNGNAWYRRLSYDYDRVARNNYGHNGSGFSVRCLKDN